MLEEYSRATHATGPAMKRLLLVLTLLSLLSLLSLSGHAGTIYLCKAYSGGTFWAQAHCSSHNALIESIISVPDNMPFTQQVALAEQQRQPVPASTTAVNTVAEPSAAQQHQAECRALDARVNYLDSLARQPQSAAMQDWNRGERKKARDRQFAIRC